MSPEVLAELKECYAATDKFTAGWLTLARTLLNKVSLIPGAVSVVVSACQLTPTLAKTMIYQLDDFVPAENIYSGSQIGNGPDQLPSTQVRVACTAMPSGMPAR